MSVALIDINIIVMVKCLARLLIAVARGAASAIGAVEARWAHLVPRLRFSEVVLRSILLLVAEAVSVAALSRAIFSLLLLGLELGEHLLFIAASRLRRRRRLRGLPDHVLHTRLAKPVIDGEVVQLSQVLMHAQYFLVLNRLLQLCLRCIALLLLFNELLNFGGVQAGWCPPVVLDVTRLDNSLDLRSNVPIC